MSFVETLEQMSKVYQDKNHDYGNSFDKTLDEFGLVAALTRLSDKMERLKTLYKSHNLVDESLQDTLLDLANYSIMTKVWLEKQHEN